MYRNQNVLGGKLTVVSERLTGLIRIILVIQTTTAIEKRLFVFSSGEST